MSRTGARDGDVLFHSRASPFAGIDKMMDSMTDPFDCKLGPFGSSGGLFKHMDDMMSRLSKGDGLGEGGAYSSKTMVYSAKRGADGKMQSEKFTSSTVGNGQKHARETQQAYSNSEKGIDKMSLERQMGEQGRKVIKERSRKSGEERQTDLFKGMQEKHSPQFDERWKSEAAPYLPSHSNPSRRQLGGRLDSQSLEMHANRQHGARGGYPSRSAVSKYTESEVGSDAVSTVASDTGFRHAEQRSSGYRQPRSPSDSSQVGSLLRHEFIGNRSPQQATSQARRRDNPFDY